MSTQKEELASKHFRRSWEVLTERERRVLHAVVERLHISRPVDLECSLTTGCSGRSAARPAAEPQR